MGGSNGDVGCAVYCCVSICEKGGREGEGRVRTDDPEEQEMNRTVRRVNCVSSRAIFIHLDSLTYLYLQQFQFNIQNTLSSLVRI